MIDTPYPMEVDTPIATEDPVVQSLLALRRGSKESRLESMRQERKMLGGKASSAAKDKYYGFEDISDIDNDSDLDISTDDDKRDDDDAAGFGVFVYNRLQELPKFTPFSPVVTTSSTEYFSNLLNDPLVHELIDLLSKPDYTDAHTTSAVANLEGNPEVLSYLSGASKVPFGTNVDVKATNFVLQEMFPDNADHQVSSPPATTTHDIVTNSQQNTLQAKAKKLMAKAKHNIHKISFKKAVEQKFKEYDQKLEALTSINVSEAIEDAVQAKVLTEMKKQLPTYVPTAIAKFVKPRLNNFVREVMKNNQISRWFNKKLGSVEAAKRKTTWFDMLLMSNIDQNEDHILGPSTIAVAKKLKELIKKDKLTIADLEGAGLEKLKKQYKNDVELEYHVDQLKAAFLTEAQ
ncbi:hypothetical protein Tco_0764535 [Tanacetum coccineum]